MNDRALEWLGYGILGLSLYSIVVGVRNVHAAERRHRAVMRELEALRALLEPSKAKTSLPAPKPNPFINIGGDIEADFIDHLLS